jgi:hypothetical protein
VNRLGRTGRAAATLLVVGLLAVGALAPPSLAVGPDKAEVVLVFDFSGSILDDKTIRNQFGAALERIADRVDETQRDLIKGDTSISIVQFASKAAEVPGCTELKVLGSPSTTVRFADCLRTVAAAYRAGTNKALTQRIGADTNYVAAMEQAEAHLPKDATRPTMILFTDGKHDVPGVPVSQVAPARDRLFGDRSPFALLPVGMGIDPGSRRELEAGLLNLQIIKDMPSCSSGSSIEWPQVAFESPDDAGNAVAVALQNATCTFTAAPVGPSPSPNSDVRGIRLTPLDGRIEVTWSAPAQTTEPITDYKVRCTPDGGEPVESAEGVSLERKTVVDGLANGTPYSCEVATVSGSSEGEWIAANASVTPEALPAPPAKPKVEALDGAVRISISADDGSAVRSYHYECSADNGATWPSVADTTGPDDTATQIGRLTNGALYVCRAFAINASGTSDASPLSDAVRPCSTFLECNGLSTPLVAAVIGLLVVAILLGLFILLRNRGTGYVIAVVDVIHTANLGHGQSLGLRFERDASKRVTGIEQAKGSKADVRIRRLRGDRFEVKDRYSTHVAESGEPIVIVDSGARHELVLRAFEGRAAAEATARR